MPSSSADIRALKRDLFVVLGIPAVLLATIAYATWPWTPEPYVAPSQEAFFGTAAGIWDWPSDSSCVANPQRITFSPDRSVMVITMRHPYENSAGDSTRVAVYDLSERSPSHVRGAIRGEGRKTDRGEPVVWDLVLESPDQYAWHRGDWAEGATTKSLHRCPEGTDSLVPALTAEERAAAGLNLEVEQ